MGFGMAFSMFIGIVMYGVLIVTIFLVVRAIMRISDAVERISRTLEDRFPPTQAPDI